MKFPMYQKESADKRYREDPFRAVNIKVNEDGDLVCPNKKKFRFLRTAPVKGNRYGRTGEIYRCEDCSGWVFVFPLCGWQRPPLTGRPSLSLSKNHRKEEMDPLRCGGA